MKTTKDTTQDKEISGHFEKERHFLTGEGRGLAPDVTGFGVGAFGWVWRKKW